jgi:hypothetical protein
MPTYYLIFGLLLVLLGICLIAWPRQTWLFPRSWRLANPDAVRLSEAHVVWSRISGVVGVLLGGALLLKGAGVW